MPYTPIDFVDQPDPLAGDPDDPKLNAANLATMQTQYEEAVDDAAAAVDARIGDDIQGTATLDADVTTLIEDSGSDVATALNAALGPGGSAGNYGADETAVALAPLHLLEVGQETIPRGQAIDKTVPLTSQIRLAYFTARKSETITSIRVVCATAAGATPTLVRFGLYSVDASGNLALIGSTPNDTTLLAAPNTAYTKALSTPAAITKGSRYAIGLIVTTGATPPLLFGSVPVVASETAAAPRTAGFVGSQANLYTPISAAGVTNSTYIPYAVAVP